MIPFNKLSNFILEDVGYFDITSDAIIPDDLKINAYIVSKSHGILAGVEECYLLCKIFDVSCKVLTPDGNQIAPKDKILFLSGSAKKILMIERVVLNILMKMSGIATNVHSLVSTCRQVNPHVKISATRKTTPGFRYFEKKAVIIGGGDPHRWKLDDMYLIKSTHVDIAGGIKEAILRVKKNRIFSKLIDVEVRNIDELLDAIHYGADIVMLDNFTPTMVVDAIKILNEKGIRNKVLIEVSGGINNDNILEYVKAGVDIISLGCLTHSYKSLDFHIELDLSGPEGI